MTASQKATLRELAEDLEAIVQAVSSRDGDATARQHARAEAVRACLAALDSAEQERDQARQARADEAREYGLAASARRVLLYELRQRAEQAEAKLAALTAPPAPHAEAVRVLEEVLDTIATFKLDPLGQLFATHLAALIQAKLAALRAKAQEPEK